MFFIFPFLNGNDQLIVKAFLGEQGAFLKSI